MTVSELFASARLSPHYWREAMDIAYSEPPSRVVEKEKRSLARKLAAYARLTLLPNSEIGRGDLSATNKPAGDSPSSASNG